MKDQKEEISFPLETEQEGTRRKLPGLTKFGMEKWQWVQGKLLGSFTFLWRTQEKKCPQFLPV